MDIGKVATKGAYEHASAATLLAQLCPLSVTNGEERRFHRLSLDTCKNGAAAESTTQPLPIQSGSSPVH